MASLSGDAGKDNLAVIYNTWASQQSDGNGVKDKSFVLDGGADEDTLSVVGNSYNGNFTGQSGQITAVLRGGSGNDLLSVIDDNAGLNNINYLGTNPYGVVKATLDGGDGNDVLSVGGVLQASLTGGAGSDVFKLTAQAYKTLLEGTRNFLTEAGSVGIVPTAMMITDFAAGAGGDVLDYSDLLRNAATTYDGSNPFTSGYLKLVQNGADTWLQVDADGGMGLQNTPLTLAVLKNVTASSLLSANFSPNYSPNGDAPTPLNVTAALAGDAGNDHLNVNFYAMASMSGGDGNDNLNANATRMASLSGDAGKDNLAVIYNTWASQQSDGNGVKDKSFVLDGGADEDTLSVVGNSYNGNFTGQSGQITAVLRGGSGNDLLSVIDDNAGLNNINYLGTNPYGVVKATLDGGDGNDVLSVGGVLQASLTGGAGSDVFKLTAQAYKTLLEGTRNFLTEAGSVGIVPTAMMITDFAAGAGGDVLDYSDLLRNAATTYDGSNPFTSGYLKLVQNGADTWLQVDADGGMGLQNTPLTLAVLKNVTASSLLSANFSPNYSPDGAAPIPLNLTGTIAAETFANGSMMGNVIGGTAILSGDAGNDYLSVNNYSMASLSGGEGDDAFTLVNNRLASISGDAGNDWMAVRYDTWASQQTDGNVVKDRNFVLDGGADQDTLMLSGNSFNGNTTSSSGQVTAVLRGGSGNDILSVMDESAGMNNSNYVGTNPYGVAQATLDGGDGEDVLSVGGVLQATLTGGAGSDVFKLTAQEYKTLLEGTRKFLTEAGSVDMAATAMVITDFAAGAGGDVLDYSDLLRNAATSYDGTNPFTSGYLKLVQNGADTWLQVDADGNAGTQSAPLTLAVLKNVTASSLLGANFNPNYPPDGAAITLVQGTSGDDVLGGTSGTDYLLGNAGNDQLMGSEGHDTLDGGADYDFVNYSNLTQGVNLNLLTGVASVGASSQSVQNIESATGTAFDDQITLGRSGGLAYGAQGHDTLIGSVGNDVLVGEAGNDLVVGGEGDDSTTYFLGSERIDQWVLTQEGTHNWSLKSGSATMFKLQANADLTWTVTDTRSDSPHGVDTLQSIERMWLDGVVVDLAAGTAQDGQGGSDILTHIANVDGTRFNDTLQGNDLRNHFKPGAGDDSVNGGADGGDVVIYNDFSTAADINLKAGYARGADIGQDALTGIESAHATQGNDTITMGDNGGYLFAERGNDVIYGGANGNWINAGPGDDTIYGGARGGSYQGDQGNDLMVGGAAQDIAEYYWGNTPIQSISLMNNGMNVWKVSSNGMDLLSVSALPAGNGTTEWTVTDLRTGANVTNMGTDRLVGVEQLVLHGVDANNQSAATTLYMSSNYGPALDATSGVVVNLVAGTAADGQGGQDVLRNIQEVEGSEYSDVITLNRWNIAIAGGGDDTLVSAKGYAVMVGGGGNDQLTGLDGSDMAVIGVPGMTSSNWRMDSDDAEGWVLKIDGVATSHITPNASGSQDWTVTDLRDASLPTYQGVDTLQNIKSLVFFDPESDFVAINVQLPAHGSNEGIRVFNAFIGNTELSGGNDSLTGTSGNDYLLGFEGNDTLVGGPGDDLLVGGEQRNLTWKTEGKTFDYNDYDTANYSQLSSGGVQLNLSDMTVTGLAGADIGTDMLRGIEEVRTTRQTDRVIGSLGELSGNDEAAGDQHSVNLLGFGGNDQFILDQQVNMPWVNSPWLNYNWSQTGVQLSYTGFTGTVSYGAAGSQQAGMDTLERISSFGDTRFEDAFDFSGMTENHLLGASHNYVGLTYGNDKVVGNGNTVVSVQSGFNMMSTTGQGIVVYLAAEGNNAKVDMSHLSINGQSLGVKTLSGVDQVRATDFADTLVGGAYDDFEGFRGRGGNDYIDGGAGTDRAEYLGSNLGVKVNMAQGQAWAMGIDAWASPASQVMGVAASSYPMGNYTLNASGTWVMDNIGVDTLRSIERIRGTQYDDVYDARGFSSKSANAGSNGAWNEFDGKGGNDTILGNGATRIVYYDASVGVEVNMGTGKSWALDAAKRTGELAQIVGEDTFSGVYQVAGSALDDLLVGGGAGRIMGDLSIEGFIGGAGSDTLDGMGGWDEAYYWDALQGISVDMGLSAGQVQDGMGGTDTLIDIEYVGGGNFDDVMLGRDDNTAQESFAGAKGNDTIDGRGGYEEVAYTYKSPTSGVVVNLATGQAQDGFGTVDTLINIEGVEGSDLNDVIIGNAQDNRLDGRLGDDTLDGGGGNDWAEYNNVEGGVTVDLSTGQAMGAAGQDVLSNIENVMGSVYNDQLTGNAGSNVLLGGRGDDSIDGGAGVDTAVFSGNVADYTISTSAAGITTVKANVGADGTDTLTRIESMAFADKTVSLAPNVLPTGVVKVTGIATQGKTLTASNTMADADGMGSVSYQWQANGQAVQGATGSTFKLGQDQVGQSISVTASYTDGNGHQESVKSTSTTKVLNINDLPTGSVTVTGLAQQGQTLTVTHKLADLDGMGQVSYQWYSDQGAIVGATADVFTPTQNHVGQHLYVRASYTDGFGKAESMFSASTGPVLNLNDAPEGGVSIVGNTWASQTLSVDLSGLSDADGLPPEGDFGYQWYANGELIEEANQATLDLTDDHVGQRISVEVSYLDGGDTEEVIASEATTEILPQDSPTEGSLTITGVAMQGQALHALEALQDDDGMGPVSLQWLADGQAIGGQTTDTLVLTQALVNKRISLNATYTDGHENLAIFTSAETALVANVNDAPTGSVTISGTAKQGLVLTANNTLADADGMGAVAYQWKANGVAIAGATGNTFKPVAAQVGQKISVTATYTDGFGTVESKTSLSTAAVVTGYSIAASGTSVNEGSAVVFTVTTTDVAVGQSVSYALTGVSAADVVGGKLTGTAVVGNNGKASFTVNLAADFVTEGSEVMSASAGGATAKVTVLDTSLASSSSNWSSLSHGSVRAFNPLTDRLLIDNNGLSASSFYLTWNGSTAVTLVGGGKSITLNTDSKSLSSANMVFSNGSVLLVGDNSAFTTNDDSANTLTGTAGADHFYGLGGNDSLVGGDGNDIFNTGYATNSIGNDTINGGAGDDTLAYPSTTPTTPVVTVNLATGMATSTQGSVKLISIERVWGTAGNDVFIGGDISHTTDAQGNRITEVFRGNGGNDTIQGDAGDFFTIADYSSNTGAQAVSANLGTGIVSDGWGGTDVLLNVDGVVGGAGHDVISGGSQSRDASGFFFELLRGNAGNDTLNGNNANTGGSYASSDRADYSTSTAAVTVNLATGVAQDGMGGTDTLIDIDQVYGGSGNDWIVGSSDRDVLDGGAGNDTLDGGANSDNVRYWQSTAGAIVNLSATALVVNGATAKVTGLTGVVTVAGGTAMDGMGGVDTLINIENIQGSNYNDYLRGSDDVNVRQFYTGFAGNDTIDGGAGIDIVTFVDTPLSMGGINVTLGSTLADKKGGVDTLINIEGVNINLTTGLAVDGWGGANNVLGLGGTDTLKNIEHAEGSDFNDVITGSATNNQLVGRDGDDTIDGGAGADTLVGGAGNDTYVVDSAADVVSEATALNGTVDAGGVDGVNSSVSYTLGSFVENLSLTGSAAINGTGNALNNLIVGNAAANTLSGGAGDDTLAGGAGNDTYVVDSTADVVSEATLLNGSIDAGGTDLVNSSVSYTLSVFVENLTLTETTMLNGSIDAGGTDLVSSSLSYTLGSYLEKLTLTGSTTINGTGNGLSNTITGNAGDNVLDGGLGADTLIGGAGNDSYVVDNAADVVSESTLLNGSIDAGGTDVVNSSVSYALGAFVENLNLTGGSAINASGNALNNLITGNAAANTLDGGLGVDTLIGGAGNDTYVVDDLADWVSEATLLNGTVDAGGVDQSTLLNGSIDSGGQDQINSSVSYTLSAFVENLSLTGGAAIHATGNALNNLLVGNAAGNTLDGGMGADTLTGGAGNDSYVVDDASDVVSESTSLNGSVDAGGVDQVNSSVNYVLGNFVENLGLTGASAINATGNALNNVIAGNTAANLLDGGLGADTLMGGAGNDTYVVDDAADQVSEATLLNGTVDAGGVDQVNSSLSYALGAFVENLNLTGNSAINGTGNALNNLITGNAAANTLNGGAGVDTLSGGAGDDLYLVDNLNDVVSESTLLNGTVDAGGVDQVNSSVNYTLSGFVENLLLTDTLAINGTGDVVSEATLLNGTVDAGGTDLVNSALTYTLGNYVENLTLTGSSAINGTGNALNNSISGNAAANWLDGGAGNDWLNGGTGADTLVGGAGNDNYVVDNMGDLVSETTLLNGSIDAGGNDTVSSSLAYTLGSFVENLTLTGTSAINGTGNALNNAITGNTAANWLDGGAGNDTLRGGLGADTLTGGAGSDRFGFAAGDAGTSSAFDVITDYLKGAAGTGDLIDFAPNLVVGGSALAATATEASINAATGLTTFAAGTGLTLADAVAKINARFVSAADSGGEFALFKVNGAGDYYLYVSDGSVATTDVVVQLVGVTSVAGINLNSGDLTLTA
eukprot:gene22412-27377_t